MTDTRIINFKLQDMQRQVNGYEDEMYSLVEAMRASNKVVGVHLYTYGEQQGLEIEMDNGAVFSIDFKSIVLSAPSVCEE